MLHALDRVTMAATVHLLVAGFVLIGVGLADLGGSAGLVVVLLTATLALFAVRGRVPPLGRVAGYDVGSLVADAWAATALAATTTLLSLGATPAELQSLGGLLGLAGMLNYFLRPVYYAVYSVLASDRGRDRPENG